MNIGSGNLHWSGCSLNKIKLGFGQIQLKNGKILSTDKEVTDYIWENKDSLNTRTFPVKDIIKMGEYIGASLKGLPKKATIDKLVMYTRILRASGRIPIPNIKMCFFDTETTGLYMGRLIQLGYIICEGDTVIEENEMLVYPCDFEVKGTEIHGITQEMAEKDGFPIKDVLTKFIEDCMDNGVRYLVCHNVPFDIDVIQRECVTAGIPFFEQQDEENGLSRNTKVFDTMRTSSVLQYYKIKKGLDRAVFPSLENLYVTIFDEPMKTPHTALADARLVKKCLMELLAKEVVCIRDARDAEEYSAVI